MNRLQDIQAALRDEKLDGWLLYDFRGSNPVARSVLGLGDGAHTTRRLYVWIPAQGEPTTVLSRVEPHVLDGAGWLAGARRVTFGSRQDLDAALDGALAGARRIAMEHDPDVPYLDRADNAAVSAARSRGAEVTSSGNLVARFEATCTAHQKDTHRAAQEFLRTLVDRTFAHAADHLRRGEPLKEHALQQWMVGQMTTAGFTTDHPPIVASGAASGNPHYSPEEHPEALVKKDATLLLDLWCRKAGDPDAVYGDITWCGYAGARVPDEEARIFGHVLAGRDAALAFVQRHWPGDIQGWQVDRACRDEIMQSGMGDLFVHRTGHSIHRAVHGNGTHMDDFETRDTRRLLPDTCFSIEPGLYLPGKFGFRSEIDVYLEPERAVVFGQPIQTALVPFLS